jgi:hypothetical protein
MPTHIRMFQINKDLGPTEQLIRVSTLAHSRETTDEYVDVRSLKKN